MHAVRARHELVSGNIVYAVCIYTVCKDMYRNSCLVIYSIWCMYTDGILINVAIYIYLCIYGMYV